MSKIIVLIGAPGAGKGTQARLLQTRMNIPQISTGDIFREMKNADTPLARDLQQILASGKLVSDKITYEVVKQRTSRGDCQGTFILDGFPRTPTQAGMLEELSAEQNKLIQAILIDVPFNKLEERLVGRRSCTECGEIYNLLFKPPQNHGFCDFHAEAPLKHRVDDTAEKVKVRLNTYEENTKPLLEYYEESGRLQKIDGTRTPEEIYRELESLVAVSNVAA